MKINKASLGIFIVAFLVLIITNIMILSGVSSNRSSEPTSHTILTERELPISLGYFSKDNNGIFLIFKYRTYTVNWLNEEKLKKLGFDTEKYKNAKYQKSILSKEVFIVLENDGNAYQESLKRAEERVMQKQLLYNEDINNKYHKNNYENAKRLLSSEQHTNSRLFAIDAGLSYEKLRQKYDNIEKYIIVRGVMQPYYVPGVGAYIKKLSIQKIHIPLKYSTFLRELSDKIKNEAAIYSYIKLNRNPEYKVELKYGKRYEPWVVSVDKIE